MTMHRVSGSCHCGNLSFEMEITNEPHSYNPRACDCGFCSKHGASYISDKDGKLTIFVINKSDLSKYRQGTQIADFLICKQCGILVAVCHEIQGNIFASINNKAVNGNTKFGKNVVVSPKQLTDNEKISRWQEIWFSGVQVKYLNNEAPP